MIQPIPSTIVAVKNQICELMNPKPQHIILFSEKKNLIGELSSFKICIVVDINNKEEVEHLLYLNIESDTPFDILIYTTQEWSRLCIKKGSFAQKVLESGYCLYE